MVSQRLRVGNLIGEFHLPEKHFKLFSTEPKFGFFPSSNSVLGSCYQYLNTAHYIRVMRIAYRLGGKDFSAETMLTILERLQWKEVFKLKPQLLKAQ